MVVCHEVDVLVAPEAEHPAALNDVLGARPLASALWEGDTRTKGLAVLSFGDYVAEVHSDFDPTHKYIVPVEVHGPVSFLLFAVWTVPGQRGWYIEPLVNAIDTYRHLLELPRVVWAGDFNQNAVWDSGESEFNFRPFVDRLSEFGIRSVYHENRRCEFGLEPEHTFYQYHHEDKGHHIDYIFASRHLLEARVEFSVGKHSDWCTHSDHMPLICTFEHGGDAG